MSQVFNRKNGYIFEPRRPTTCSGVEDCQCEGCNQNKDIPRGWHIEPNIKPIPDRRHDYDFWHDNYDGADGGNGLCGTAESREDALSQIREIEQSV